MHTHTHCASPQVRLTPEEGYGEREEEAVITVPGGEHVDAHDTP